MRERLVIGNWKMNPPTIAEAVELARDVAGRDAGGVAVGVAPPAIALAAVADALRDANVDVYAQDVHWEERGAFTGQISVSMVRGLAVGTIVGHSEVRRDLGDTDERVAMKLARAVAAGLRPVLCVGESATEHAAGNASVVVVRQIMADLKQAPRRGPGSVPPGGPLRARWMGYRAGFAFECRDAREHTSSARAFRNVPACDPARERPRRGTSRRCDGQQRGRPSHHGRRLRAVPGA